MEDGVITKREKIKRHFRENKIAYIAAGTGAAISAAVTTIVIFHRFGGFPVEVSQTAKNTALVIWKPEITQVALVKKCCPDPIPVRDKLTGMDYPSIRNAAKATKETIYAIRNDVHGLADRFEELPDSVFVA